MKTTKPNTVKDVENTTSGQHGLTATDDNAVAQRIERDAARGLWNRPTGEDDDGEWEGY